MISLGIYLGLPVGRAYFDYWSLKDEMQTQARLAAGVDDGTIRRRVLERIRALELPDEAARNLRVRRQNRQIIISTNYEVTFDFRVKRVMHRFTPQARQPL